MIVSSLNLFNSFSFVDHNLKSNFTKIVHEDVLLDDESNFRRDAEKIKPVVLSNEEAFYSCESSVDKSGSFVESDSISADDTFVLEMDTVSSLFVDFITDNYFSIVDEANFIEFIKFVNENAMSSIFSWFKICQKFVHEVSIILVNPCVINVS